MKNRLWTTLAFTLFASIPATSNAAEVIAFWDFNTPYDLTGEATAATKINFTPTVDNTIAGNANLQAFGGRGADLRQDSGSGKLSYTSPISGITYAAGSTLEWDDLAGGGGDDFDIGGVEVFSVNKAGVTGPDDFGNDALMYLTLDTTNFRNLQVRFEVEGDPANLPSTFDIFTRTSASDTWFRTDSQNNIALTFQDYPDPLDGPDQFALTGFISLTSAFDNAGMVELIISDFNEFGNDEMEIDNLEIIGTAVPEPSTLAALAIGGLVVVARRRRRQCAAFNRV